MGIFTDKQYLEAAQKGLQEDGDLEFDEGPLPETRVSNGDDHGAYVLAWKWVEDSDIADILDLPYKYVMDEI